MDTCRKLDARCLTGLADEPPAVISASMAAQHSESGQSSDERPKISSGPGIHYSRPVADAKTGHSPSGQAATITYKERRDYVLFPLRSCRTLRVFALMIFLHFAVFSAAKCRCLDFRDECQ